MGGREISEEEVIRKVKDDGDFDRIRLNIVRILKQNEDLRSSIISAVKESAALNQTAAENMTPWQLCDAIHDEIKETVMLQISDGLWQIIRSEETIKTQITQTVHSLYNTLLKPEGQSPKGPHFNACHNLLDGEFKEPPGFSLQNHTNHDISLTHNPRVVDPKNNGITAQRPRERASNANDEAPDIPPGFG